MELGEETAFSVLAMHGGESSEFWGGTTAYELAGAKTKTSNLKGILVSTQRELHHLWQYT